MYKRSDRKVYTVLSRSTLSAKASCVTYGMDTDRFLPRNPDF